MKNKIALMVAAASAAMSGCTTAPSLVFGQSHSVGISIGGGASDMGAELSIGYKDRDIAVVPVAIVKQDGTINEDGMVTAQVSSRHGSGYDTDSLSVLGQFKVDTNATAKSAGLGKFFATGLAAQKLADGFACQLSGEYCPTDETPEADEEETQTAEAEQTGQNAAATAATE